MHWSIPILEKLLPTELFIRLFETQCDPTLNRGSAETIELRNSGTGEVLKIIPTPNMKRVSRKKLRSLCAEGIQVHWGKTFEEVTYDSDGNGVTAHFAGGLNYRGDVLVGTDGPKSKAREILLGPEKSQNTTLEIVFNIVMVKYGDAKKALHVRSGHPQNLLGYNPNGIHTVIASMYQIFGQCVNGRLLTSSKSRTFQIQRNQRLGDFNSVPPGWAKETLA
jgi:hypothetical protein